MCSRRTASSPQAPLPRRPAVSPGSCSSAWPISPTSIDELARAAGLAPGDVAAALIELELAGRISEEDGVYRVTITR